MSLNFEQAVREGHADAAVELIRFIVVCERLWRKCEEMLGKHSELQRMKRIRRMLGRVMVKLQEFRALSL